MELNKKLLKLVIDNPELEVKFNISGECNEDDISWYIGDIISVDVGYHIEYEGRIWHDYEDVIDTLNDDLSEQEMYQYVSPEDFESIVQDEYNKLPKKKVIWVYVGV